MQIANQRDIAHSIHNAANYYRTNLTQYRREFLTQEVGLTETVISRFLIGYSDGNLFAFLKTLTKHREGVSNDVSHWGVCDSDGNVLEYLLHMWQVPVEVYLRGGVLKRRGSGPTRDALENLVTFPTLKHGGAVYLTGVTFWGKKPKCRHLLSKSAYLYNEDVLLQKTVFLVGGLFECLAMVQRGFPAVALVGITSFNEEDFV